MISETKKTLARQANGIFPLSERGRAAAPEGIEVFIDPETYIRVLLEDDGQECFLAKEVAVFCLGAAGGVKELKEDTRFVIVLNVEYT